VAPKALPLRLDGEELVVDDPLVEGRERKPGAEPAATWSLSRCTCVSIATASPDSASSKWVGMPEAMMK
jgi:hypothetical protein